MRERERKKGRKERRKGGRERERKKRKEERKKERRLHIHYGWRHGSHDGALA
jgi:hypothetical protein